MRPDRHSDRRRPLPARDRHGVREPRHRLDPQAARQRAGRGGDRSRRDRLHGLLRPVGSARSRHPVERDLRRPLERGVPVHDRAADRGGRCAVPRPAGDLCRRARVGAVSERGIRRSALGHARRPPASRSGCRPPATARSIRCAWRRATERGARTSPPRSTRSRPGWGSRSGWTCRGSSGTRRSSRCWRGA